MAKGFAPTFRFWILTLCIVAGYGAIGYRLVELHVIERGKLVQEIQQHRYRVITINARRGEIYDTNKELLATSQVVREVGVDPALAEASDLDKLPELARLLELSVEEVEDAFGARDGQLLAASPLRRERWRRLKKSVEEPVYQQIEALGMRCVYGNRQFERVYPKGQLAAHVLGYVRDDGEAVAGVEREFDFYLSGQRGWREAEVKAGKEMAQFRRREVPARDGMNVALTIDAYVQHTIEEELKKIGEAFRPESASIIVSDPYTGELLGLANYPTFDPNDYARAELQSQKNRALTDPVEPGSTFKIVVASAVFEESLVQGSTTFDCSQDTIVTPSGYVARLPRDSHEHGILTVEEIVALSSNRGAAHLAKLLGEDGFYRYVRKFGFGEPTGLKLGIESWGIVHHPDDWDGLTITRMPMGHAIGATPMQIHFAMAAIANGGVLMRPQTVAGVMDPNTGELLRFGPLPKRRVVSRSTARTVAALLEKTVSDQGTAQVAAIPGYRVAGKTGTTQKIVEGRYSREDHVGSFSGFFPAHNPRVVITVIVDGAKVPGVAYGSRVAAPSFKSVGQRLIPYYALSPSESQDGFALVGNQVNLR